MKVSIIGAGNMARGIGSRVLAGGNDLEVVARDQSAAQAVVDELGGGTASGTASGDVVVLAIPYGAAADVVASHGEELRGKVVVDITNPVDWSTFEGLVTPADSSAAEEIAKLVPDGTVVKAFNTTFAPTLSAGGAGGQSLDVLLAGDDAGAKEKVASIVEAGGLRPLDIGPLRRARQLEQLGFLHITAQEPLGAGFASALKLHW